MWNRIRAVVLGALVVSTAACATVPPPKPMSQALAIVAASVLVDPDQAADVVREAIATGDATATKITAVAVLCAPTQSAAITSAAVRAMPEHASAIRSAARWAERNRTSFTALSIPSGDAIVRFVERAGI